MRFFYYFLSISIVLISLTNNILAKECKKPLMPSEQEWQNWLSETKKEALKIGISELTILNELSTVKPQSKIIMRDRCQPESTISLKEYLYYRVDKVRIIAGKNILKKYSKELEEIGEFFNIQPRFIVAVLGMESFYGKNQGNINEK